MSDEKDQQALGQDDAAAPDVGGNRVVEGSAGSKREPKGQQVSAAQNQAAGDSSVSVWYSVEGGDPVEVEVSPDTNWGAVKKTIQQTSHQRLGGEDLSRITLYEGRRDKDSNIATTDKKLSPMVPVGKDNDPVYVYVCVQHSARARAEPTIQVAMYFGELAQSQTPEHPFEACLSCDLTIVDVVNRESALATVTRYIEGHLCASTRHDLVYIFGTPGSGKTRLLHTIATRWAGRACAISFNGRTSIFEFEANSFTASQSVWLRVVFALYGVEGDWNDFVTRVASMEGKDDIPRLGLQVLKALKSHNGARPILLVDETLRVAAHCHNVEKAEKIVDGLRSDLCRQVDKGDFFVIFSSLESTPMHRELSSSTRQCTPVDLRLLDHEHSVGVLQRSLQNVQFAGSRSGEWSPVDPNEAFALLAHVSGGLPRALEVVIRGCNSQQSISVEAVIEEVVERLGARPLDFLNPVLPKAILGKRVVGTDQVGQHSWDRLVACGLVHPFEPRNQGFVAEFIPCIPEPVLRAWCKRREGQDHTIAEGLGALFKLRVKFGSKDFESFHVRFEVLRFIALHLEESPACSLSQLFPPLYSRLSAALRNVRVKCPEQPLDIQSCTKYSAIAARVAANTLLVSDNLSEPGVDALLVLETTRNQTLVVGLQMKFSDAIDTSNGLKLSEVRSACDNFNKLGFPQGTLKVLVFVVHRHVPKWDLSELPENLAIVGPDQFPLLYGPTLLHAVSSFKLGFMSVQESVRGGEGDKDGEKDGRATGRLEADVSRKRGRAANGDDDDDDGDDDDEELPPKRQKRKRGAGKDKRKTKK